MKTSLVALLLALSAVSSQNAAMAQPQASQPQPAQASAEGGGYVASSRPSRRRPPRLRTEWPQQETSYVSLETLRGNVGTSSESLDRANRTSHSAHVTIHPIDCGSDCVYDS